ncbi:MAG: EamA family transporter [Armatimonadetes bacterium]|nr:EamA family transporter [Candidatus Hippobium faecium]
MSLIAVILIIASSFMHIGWNYLIKYISSDSIYMVYVYILTSVLFCPALIYYRNEMIYLLPLTVPLILSAFFKAFANWSLVRGYRYGDYSYIYPLRNALPMVFSCIWGVIIGKAAEVTPVAYIGFLFVFIGCLLIPVHDRKDFSLKNYINRSFIYTFLSSLATAGYSVIDSFVTNRFNTVSHLDNFSVAIFLIPIFYSTLAIFMFQFIWLDKKLNDKKDTAININRKPYKFWHILIHALCMSIGYLLILIAFTYADNVSYVVAFRQIGMPISFIVGYFILKEKIYPGKAIGLITIITGLLMTVK